MARVSHESLSQTTIQIIILTTMALSRRRISPDIDVETSPHSWIVYLIHPPKRIGGY